MFEDIKHEISFLYSVCENYDVNIEPENDFDALNALAKIVGVIAILQERESKIHKDLFEKYYFIEKKVLDEKKEKKEEG